MPLIHDEFMVDDRLTCQVLFLNKSYYIWLGNQRSPDIKDSSLQSMSIHFSRANAHSNILIQGQPGTEDSHPSDIAQTNHHLLEEHLDPTEQQQQQQQQRLGAMLAKRLDVPVIYAQGCRLDAKQMLRLKDIAGIIIDHIHAKQHLNTGNDNIL